MTTKSIIFDGKAFAAEKEISLGMRVLGLKARGIYPKLASIIVGNNPASELYVNLKKRAAENIGAEVDIYFIKEISKVDDLILLIDTLNVDETVNGIMIQLPLPPAMSKFKDRIIESIDPKKDVDGLRIDSQFLHPTSKAVIDILKFAEKGLKVQPKTVCVVGATGMVGTPLVKELKTEGYKVIECDTKTTELRGYTLQGDVVISTTGTPGLIKSDMIKKDTIVIDVGSPKGDVETSVSEKASFITPVPGGVGPVTISSLLENLISAC
jgi:methylenetetrahydrofolate dehydrogenase (NADP+)/methenyltetrahydrofolate cyclohydrolase